MAKIDDAILLELINKGLTNSEIARYFDVQPSSVRSKINSLERRKPEFEQAIAQRNPKDIDKDASLQDRFGSYSTKIFSDAANILSKLQVTPIPDDIPGMILRSDLQLKGLQIVERIQKILGMSQGEGPKALQVNQITNYLGNKSTTRQTSQDSQIIDAEQVDHESDVLWQRRNRGVGGGKK